MRSLYTSGVNDTRSTFPVSVKTVLQKSGIANVLVRHAKSIIIANIAWMSIVSLMFCWRLMCASLLQSGLCCYWIGFVLLAALQKGYGCRHARLITVLHILMVIVLLSGCILFVVAAFRTIYQ